MKRPSMKNMSISKMKFSAKHAKIACAIIIVLAIGAFVYIGLMYNDEQGKQDDLTAEVESARHKWEDIKDRPVEDLGSVLQLTKEELAYWDNMFPIGLDSNDVTEILLYAAIQSRVDILPLSGIKPGVVEEINGNQYLKMDFNLRPKGTIYEVLSFVNSLETGNIGEKQYGTMVLDDVRLQGRGGAWTATFRGSIYSRLGTAQTGS